MSPTKKNIRSLLAEGLLREAAQATLVYAEYCGLPAAANGLTVLSGTLEEHRRQWNTGQISYEEFARAHARLAQGLADWLDRLPDQPVTASGRKRKLIEESVFKRRILILLIVSKAVVIARLSYMWSTGGFTNEQAQATMSLLAPAFAAYLSVILGSYLLEHRNQDVDGRKFVAGPLVAFGWWLFPLYVVVILWFINRKAAGDLSFAEMNIGLGLVESVLGGYVGQIVMAFFKKSGD